MLRVVLDTNVLISALAFQGETKKIWDLAETGQFSLFTSAFILSELERNLLKLGLEVYETAILIEEVRGLRRSLSPAPRSL